MEDLREPLIARTGELDRLAAAYALVEAGSSRTVLVAGEAGIGKTSLVRAATNWIRREGGRVLWGGCLPIQTGDRPYGPFVEALRELVRDLEPGALPAILGPNRAELARLVPEVPDRPWRGSGDGTADGPPTGDQRTGSDDRYAQVRLFEIVLGVVERLAAAGPLAVVIEDLHWADPSTLDLLAFLVHNLRDERVLVIATVRSEEVADGAGVQAHLAELERRDTVERIDLARLGHNDVAVLIERELGRPAGPDLVERVWRRTDGNPFYTEQVLTVATELDDGELPPRLRDILLARVAAVSPAGQAVLRAASAAGARIDDDLLAEATDLEPEVFRAALREVTDRRILEHAGRAADPHLVFRHALLREVIHAELFAGERARLHERYAKALEARAADRAAGRPVAGPAPSAAELAYHWEAAGDDRRALAATVNAGRAAESGYAWVEAHRHYVRALALWDRIGQPDAGLLANQTDLLARAADTAVLIGEATAAVDYGRQAIAALDADADPVRAGALHERLRWYLWEAGDRAAAAAAVDEAERLIPADPPSQARARVLAHRAAILMGEGRLTESAAAAEAALAIARTVGSPADEALALGVLGWDLALGGQVEEGIERLQAATAIAEQLQNAEGIALGATNLAMLLDRAGRTAAALDVAVGGYDRVRALGVERTYGGLLLATAAKAAMALGRWDDADGFLATGLRGDPAGVAGLRLRIQRGRLDTWRGDFDEAAAALARARADLDAQPGSDELASLLAAEAELAAIRDRLTDGRAAVDAGFALAGDGLPDPALASLAATGLRMEAEAAVGARARRDVAAVDRAVERAGRIAAEVRRIEAGLRRLGTTPAGGAPSRITAIASHCRAEAARVAGDDTATEWSGVAAAYEAIERPYAAAYARFRAAAALLRDRGDRAGARSLLAAAHGTATTLGARPLRDEIERLARQARLDLGPVPAGSTAGAPTTGPSTDPDHGLTERELEVLRLIAGGWTNDEIAQALFISRKTASVHASHIFDKLDASNRAEAGAIALRIGLVADPPPRPGALPAADDSD